MSDFQILDENKNAVKISLDQFLSNGGMRRPDTRRVAETEIVSGIRVSTVFFSY